MTPYVVNYRYQYGPIVQPETNTSGWTTIHHYWTHVPDTLSLESSQGSQTFKFVTSIHTEKTKARLGYTTALAMSAQELYWMHSKVRVFETSLVFNLKLIDTLYIQQLKN